MMAKLSITNGQFEAMREAICKSYQTVADPRECATHGHVKCRKAAYAALTAMRKVGE